MTSDISLFSRLGKLPSIREATVASLMLSNLLRASITRRTQANHDPIVNCFLFHFLLHHSKAYERGFYGSKYVWILMGWYQPSWWKVHTAHASKVHCKPSHIAKASGNYIVTAFRKIGPSSAGIIVGKVGASGIRVCSLLRRLLCPCFHPFIVDSLWIP